MSQRKPRVLITEDNPENGELLAAIIGENTGYEVVLAHDGLETLKLTEQKKPDLILIEIVMPGLNGYEVAQELSTRSGTQDIPIIFITSLNSPEDKAMAFQSGGIDYITKPFNKDEVLSRVNAHIKLRQQYRQIMNFHEEMSHELTIAKTIQQYVIHNRDFHFPNLEVAVRYLTAEKIGGDIYEIRKIGDNQYMLFIADVTGHGVPAALYTMLIKSALPLLIQESLSPSEILTRMNKELCKVLVPEFFVTGILAIVDTENKTVTYSNSAHPAPFRYSLTDKTLTQLEHRSSMLGVFKHIEFREETLPLTPDDRILLFTDGITETESDEGKLLGKKRLGEIFSRYAHLSGEECLEEIVKETRNHTRENKFTDDVTLIVLKSCN